MDDLNKEVKGGYSFQVNIQPSLAKKIGMYVSSNQLHTFFKNAVFDYRGVKLKKNIADKPDKTYCSNHSRLYEIGKSNHAKQS